MKQRNYEPPYPRENYDRAAMFMQYMHKNRRHITRSQYADLRTKALSGDIDGAMRELGMLLADRWA